MNSGEPLIVQCCFANIEQKSSSHCTVWFLEYSLLGKQSAYYISKEFSSCFVRHNTKVVHFMSFVVSVYLCFAISACEEPNMIKWLSIVWPTDTRHVMGIVL